MADSVNSQARPEANFQRVDLVDQRQLVVKARNSHCRPETEVRDGLLTANAYAGLHVTG